MNSEQHNEASPQYRPVTLADLVGKKVKLLSHGVEKIIHVETDLGDGKVEVRKYDTPLIEYFVVDSAIEDGVEVYVWLDAQQSWGSVAWLKYPWFAHFPGEFSGPFYLVYTGVEDKSVMGVNAKIMPCPDPVKYELRYLAEMQRQIKERYIGVKPTKPWPRHATPEAMDVGFGIGISADHCDNPFRRERES